MNIPQRTYEGTNVELSRIFLRSGAGTVTVPALRFFDLKGLQVNGGSGGQPVSLTLDTTWRSLRALWETAALALDSSASFAQLVDGRRAVSALSDAASGEVWVSFGDPSPAVPSVKVAGGSALRIGPLPKELGGGFGQTQSQVAAVWDSPALALGTLTGVNDSLVLSCAGMGTAVFEMTSIVSAAPVLVFEVSLDGGLSWKLAPALSTTTSSHASTVAGTTTANISARYFVNCAGGTQVRARASSIGGGPHGIQGSVSANPWTMFPSTYSGDAGVRGAVVHDSASSSVVLQSGMEARSGDPAAVQNGDAVRAISSLLGKGVVLVGALPAQTWAWAGPAGGITGAGTTVIQPSGGAGIRHYLRSLQINNQSATGTGVMVRDGSGGAVLWRTRLEGDTGASGFSASFEPPLRGSVNTSLVLELDGPGEVYANGQGYQAGE